MKKEIWKDVPGWEGYYQACNLGLVRSLDRLIIRRVDSTTRLIKGKILSCNRLTNDGHVKILLSENGVRKECLLHRLVMLTFVGPSDLVVNHKNNNKSDNSLDNLEYITQLGNVQHAIENGFYREKNPAVISDELAVEILYKHIIEGMSPKTIAEECGVKLTTLRNLTSGRGKLHVSRNPEDLLRNYKNL